MWAQLTRPLSKLTGRIANAKIPGALRQVIHQRAAALLNIDLAESPVNLGETQTLNRLFTRPLTPTHRPIDTTDGTLVSPSDSTIDQMGPITSGKLIQAKGITYTVCDLLGTEDHAFASGSFFTLYLSPSDCHRVFSPYSGTITATRHIPGLLYPVRPPYTHKVTNLFAINERLVIDLNTNAGPITIVMVGAFNVGTITTPFDPTIRTNMRQTQPKTRRYTPEIPVEKGQWIGTFELGSTVILLTKSPLTTPPNIGLKSAVKYGQPIGNM